MESWREELHVNELYHHGIAGQKWGVRRYQNLDGSVTAAGARRYYEGVGGKTNRWGLSLGQRDANGNTRYISKADQPGRHGGGGGGGSDSGDSGSSASSSSGEEERTNSAEKRASQVARAQEIADQERADKEAWIQSLRERVQNRPGKKAEEEKSSKKSGSSKASSGVAMTPEQVAEALKKILGDDAASEEPKEEPKQEPAEEPAKEEPVNEPSEPEEEEPDENNLSEDEEKELGGYMVDPVTDKVYRVDEETGDAYEVDPKTGKTMEGKHVNLQKSKLEGLVSAIRQGAENFREAFRNVVNSIRGAKKGAEENEEVDEDQKRRQEQMRASKMNTEAIKGSNNPKGATGEEYKEHVDSYNDDLKTVIGNRLANQDSPFASKKPQATAGGTFKNDNGIGKAVESAVNEVNYNGAKAAMTDADAAKLKSMIKAETNDTKKAELQQLLRRQVQQRLQSKR